MQTMPNKPKRIRPIWFKIGAIIIGLLAAVLICEFALRLTLYFEFHSYMSDTPVNPPAKANKPVGFGQLVYRVKNDAAIYRLKPHAQGKMAHPVRINSLGFRDDEVKMPKPARTFRIVCLGDSTMFGWAIARQDDYIEMIEDDLQEAVGNSWKIECINTAVPAYNSAQEVALFHESCLALQPDAVLIQFELNDDLIFPYAMEPPFLFGLDFFLGRMPDYWSGKYKTMDALIMAIQGERLYKAFPNAHGWESIERSYADLVRTCKERKLPLIVLMPPFEARPDAPDKTDDERFTAFRALCQKLGVKPIEIFKTIQNYSVGHDLKYTDLIVSATDVHANEVGHALIAEAVLPSIEKMLLPKLLGEKNAFAQRPPDSNRAMRYTTGHGFYETEDWGGVAVNWTKLNASTEFDPLGRKLKMKWCVGHRDASTTSPVKVKVLVTEANPASERTPTATGYIETTRRHVQTAEFTYTKNGYYSEAMDLSGFAPGHLKLEVTVNRLFNTPPDWRHLGVALFPLAFDERN